VKRPEKERQQFTNLTPNLATDESIDKKTGEGLLDVTVPSVSGFYIELAERGKLRELWELNNRRIGLHQELAKITAQLQQINDRGYLLKFGHGRANFPEALRKKAATLEELKRKKSSLLSEIESKITQIDTRVLDLPVAAVSTQRTASSYEDRPRELSDAGKRDQVIRQLSATTKSSLAICIGLDFTLANRDAPPTGIPRRWVQKHGERWQRSFGWRFYQAAYEDRSTRSDIRKLISVAKKK